MGFFTVVVRGLMRRPVRTLLTAAGVALGVGLIVALLSIAAGTERTAGDHDDDHGLAGRLQGADQRLLVGCELRRRVVAEPFGVGLLTDRDDNRIR